MRSLVVALLFPAVASAVPPGLKKSGPLKCAGSETLVVSKRYIEAKGDGIAARGRCKVTITDSHIVSRAHAISAVGDVEITIRNSILKGRKSALYAVDRARVHSKGNTFSGGLLVMGQANYDDQGENKIERSPEAASVVAVVAAGDESDASETPAEGEAAEGEGAAEGEATADTETAAGESAEATGDSGEAAAAAKTVLPEKLRKSRPVVCRRTVKAITLKKRVIDSKGDGVIIYGNCVVTVEQSLIKAGRWAISHQGKGKLIIKDSIIQGRKGAMAVRFTPAVEVGGSTLRGKVDLPDEVEITDRGGNTFE